VKGARGAAGATARALAVVVLLATMGAPAAAVPPVTGESAAPRAIAITLDDLPGAGPKTDLESLRDMNRRILAALSREHVPAIGFVNEGRLQVDGERDARATLLRDWIEAGMDLGNHTFAHRGLTGTALDDYEDDVLRGEVVTRALLEKAGRRPVFFRHPFTQTGPTPEIKASFEEFLARHRYRVAPFTIEDADYMFNALYRDARAAGDAERAARVRVAYAAHQARMLDWFERLASDLFGRDIAQVLLIHVNAINADTLPDRLAALRARGYRFVTLAAALDDDAYATPDRYVGANGPSWLHRWSVAKGAPPRLRDEPDPPAWVLDAWKKLQGAGGDS
jgi:peptidoglycan/xylan/chitin deacetylase (PgdA/CDA1 family)